MASLHSRSNSFPTQSHPLASNVEDQLRRLMASEATSTSTDSMCSKLDSLRILRDDINNLIQMPRIQQTLTQACIDELLEESLALVDLCGFARDVLCLKKDSLQEIQSCIRRSRRESATTDEVDAYLASQKKINKKVKKFIKNFRKETPEINDLKDVVSVIKESAMLDLSTLKLVIVQICEEKHVSKRRNQTLLSRFIKVNRVHSEEVHDECFSLKKLEESEMSIEELEEGLEDLFRSLVKTRVSLLNVLTH